MPSVWVKWQMSAEYSELTINDVLGEVLRATDNLPCEARGELHSGKMYIVKTARGAYVLCQRCCMTLALLLDG